MQEWQEKIEQRLTEIERKQQTEPIKVIIEKQVEESPLLQRIFDEVGRSNTNIGVLQNDMEKVKADILAIRESQADFRDTLKTMATKEDIASIKTTQERILKLLQQKPSE